jgi:tRNA nucleotidyltransferase (CCA-adding enzyme)
LARRARAFDAAGLGRLPAARRRRLRLALLARDLAFTPAEARRFLERRRFPGDDARAVGRLLELVREASRIEDERSEWRWIRDAGPLAEDALRLVPLACPKARGEARRLAAGLRRRAAPLAVGGGDVLRWLGVAPGPHVGRLLRELEIEVLSGRVKGRPEARRWLRTAWRALLAQGAAPGSEREGGL